jgi:cellulose synthase/poly-beta-1,6-N-acetylglucosamine synthase-like glycosyltransferase
MDSFQRILGLSATLLILVLVAAFVMPPPWSWAVGLVYIAYDTWLLSSMVIASHRALSAVPRRRSSARPLRLAVVVAARNERTVLPRCIDAVLSQSAPPDRLLIVDDGSTDGTDGLLSERYGVRFEGKTGSCVAIPALHVLRKPNSGKARSLNEALSQVDEDVIVTLDADTYLEPGALAALRTEFEQNQDLAAACGVLQPVCGPGIRARLFELYQRFEYLRGFLWRLAWMDQNTLVLVSGAFAAFRRERLAEVSGFDPHSLVEDYELLFRLHRRAAERGAELQVHVVGGARATTDSPASLALFLRQRTRWFAGFLETMFRHREMVGSRRYARLGSFHLRVKTGDTLLPVYGLAAVLVFVGLLASGHRVGGIVLFAIVAKLLFDLTCHFYSMILYQRWQQQPLTLGFSVRALLATLTEPLGFQLLRQFGAVLGWIAFLRGRIEWHPQRAVTSPSVSPPS